MVRFGEQSRVVKFYLVPSLEGKAYFGINFWKAFHIRPVVEFSVSSIEKSNKMEHNLTPVQRDELDFVMREFPSAAILGLGKTNLIEHKIELTNNAPIKQRYYPISPAVQECVDEEIDRMLNLGVIEESTSAYSSPIVLVRKANGKARLCLDFRKVNAVSVKYAYPTPIIDGLLGRLRATSFITSLNLKDAFWQIPLARESRDKTAFTVPGHPLYQFKVMPFGLCNAAQTLCRLMQRVIPHELSDRVFVYLDDLLIVSENFEEHMNIL